MEEGRNSCCPIIGQLQQQSSQCVITEAYKILESILSILEPEMATRDEKLILNMDAFAGLENVRGRTYRLVIETHQKDASGHVILSEDQNERTADLVMNGGKSRFKFSVVYYDSCEEEVEDDQCHSLFTAEMTIHDTKAASSLIVMGSQLAESLRVNSSVLSGDSSPVRTVISKHIKYTTDEEEQSNSHYTVFKNRFCYWNTFKATTAASLDDTHNFVYGGPCNVDTILYHKQPKQNKSVVPDSWENTLHFMPAGFFLKELLQ
jgi:hypothetical protein